MTSYPLPEGVEDGILNRAQLARAFGVSENTITTWIGKEMPVASKGDNGRAYEFHLSECWNWRQSELAEKARTEAEGDRIAAVAAQAFLNLGDEASTEGGMSPEDAKRWAEAEIKRADAAKRRGDYVATGQVKDLIEGLLVDFRLAMVTLPDFAERELGLPPADVVKLEKRCNAALEETKARIARARLGDAEITDLPSRQEALPL